MQNKTKLWIGFLSVSIAAIGGIKAHEGFRSKPYYDVGRVATVGYGSTVHENGRSVKITDAPVSLEKADKMLRAHVAKDEAKLKAMLPNVQLSQAEYNTYVDFLYQYGAKTFEKSSIRRELLRGNHKAACRALLRYKYAAGRDCSVRKNGCYGVWKRQLDRYNKCMEANR